MGIQITIKHEDMIAAGWVPELNKFVPAATPDDPEWGLDGFDYMTYSKGGVTLHSYSATDFYADCNEWGSNRSRFRSLGLLDLPHVLG